MEEELIELLKSKIRYKDFVFLQKPVPFQELFEDEDIDVVQLHSLQTFDILGGKDIVGFCGAFEWKDNQLKPLDGDSYYPDTLVYGYERWENNEYGTYCKGLDILVKEW